MYLQKRTLVKNYSFMKKKDLYSILVKKGGKVSNDINPEKVSEIIEEAGYWRKANAIHGWFVDHVQEGEDDCREYFVSHEQLQELLDTINKVLKNKKLASELLPVRAGFFFGNYDEEKGYDKWYFESLKDTKEILTEALKNKDASYYYTSSW